MKPIALSIGVAIAMIGLVTAVTGALPPASWAAVLVLGAVGVSGLIGVASARQNGTPDAQPSG